MELYVLMHNPWDDATQDYGSWHFIGAFTDKVSALETMVNRWDSQDFLFITKDGEAWNFDELTLDDAIPELERLTDRGDLRAVNI